MNIQLRRKSKTIYVLFYRQNNRVMVSTGLKCEDKQWNDKANKLRLVSADDYRLDAQVSDFVNQVATVLQSNPKAPNEQIKELIKNPVREITVRDVGELFLEHIRNTGSPAKHSRYTTIIDRLHTIAPQLTWGDINMKLYDKILKWYHANDYGVNTIGRHITYFKTFFTWAAQRGYLKDLQFQNFKSFSRESEVIYLNETELQQVATAPMKTDQLDRVRDLFVFMCYTGLRHSDAVSLRPAHFHENMVVKTSIKTNDPDMVIPLVGHSLRIAEKYQYQLPKISSQKMNDNLRKIGEAAGIDKPTATTAHKASGKVERILPKYELMTSKMARKTFVTLSLQKGMPADVIMSITGHKKHEVMRKYLKVANTLKFKEMGKWE